MFAIMFPGGRVTLVQFLIWMDQNVVTFLACQDGLRRRGLLLFLGIGLMICLNSLVEPAPRRLSLLRFQANPVKGLLNE
jgi:hypothetical protein